jgi:hypothetical protein
MGKALTRTMSVASGGWMLRIVTVMLSIALTTAMNKNLTDFQKSISFLFLTVVGLMIWIAGFNTDVNGGPCYAP